MSDLISRSALLKELEKFAYGIECYCEIDGHRIGYIETFEGWCRRWKKDRTFYGERKDNGVV